MSVCACARLCLMPIPTCFVVLVGVLGCGGVGVCRDCSVRVRCVPSGMCDIVVRGWATARVASRRLRIVLSAPAPHVRGRRHRVVSAGDDRPDDVDCGARVHTSAVLSGAPLTHSGRHAPAGPPHDECRAHDADDGDAPRRPSAPRVAYRGPQCTNAGRTRGRSRWRWRDPRPTRVRDVPGQL